MSTLKRHRIENVCHTISRNIAYYRVVCPSKGLGNNFWRTVSVNFINIAVLDWCKIFAEDAGKHYWKEVIPRERQDCFFQDMLIALKVTEVEFQEYVQSTKEYRNKFVAHLDDTGLMLDDANFKMFPELELLIESTKFLLTYLYPKLKPSITEYYEYAGRSAQEEISG
jgi:hypothetical protein